MVINGVCSFGCHIWRHWMAGMVYVKLQCPRSRMRSCMRMQQLLRASDQGEGWARKAMAAGKWWETTRNQPGLVLVDCSWRSFLIAINCGMNFWNFGIPCGCGNHSHGMQENLPLILVVDFPSKLNLHFSSGTSNCHIGFHHVSPIQGGAGFLPPKRSPTQDAALCVEQGGRSSLRVLVDLASPWVQLY